MAKERNKNSARREIPVKEVSHFSLDDQQVRHRIAQKAYELYERRGCSHGCDLDDWLEAEQLVVAEIDVQAAKTPANSKRKQKERSEVAGTL